MKDVSKLAIVLVIAIGAVVSFFAYLDFSNPVKHDGFAKCLTEKGFVMAGTDWCHICKKQKELFRDSFSLVNYKNCDNEKEWCAQREITGYPTWIDSNGEGKQYVGLQSLEKLSDLSGCSLSGDSK